MAEYAFDRWWHIDALFAEALDLPEAARTAFLDQACTDDPDLRREVDQLLLAHQAGMRFLEDPADWFDAPLLPGLSTEQASAAPNDPRRIGPYRLLGTIGHGGMGTVYLAERADGQFQQRVALKLLRHGLTAEQTLRRFRLERQILASLEHPHIARLLDGGVADDGRPYFVMEYVEGLPLTHYCDNHRLPINERLRLFRTVCAAVQYAHQNLVVHRDLKPGNILVSDDGTVKLLDFGIAKLLDEAPPMTKPMTGPGLRLMTPEYASPEQIRGEIITTASDVYALGVLLYELLTGHRPYQVPGRVPEQIERIICEETPEKPSTAITWVEDEADSDGGTGPITPEVVSRARSTSTERLRRRLSGDLDTIVLKALRKEPVRRYTSAEQLRDDLRRHLGGLPVRARPDTPGYRAAKFIRRHRIEVAVAAVFIFLILGFAGMMARQARQTARERDKAEQVSSFLVALFEVSDPSETRGNTVTAREILDQGAGRIAQELAHQPEVQATMMDVIGRVYEQLGLYEEAASLLEEALTTRQALFGGANPDVAESLHNLGTLLIEQGAYEEAEHLHRQALAMRRTLFGEEHPGIAQSMNGLAWSLHAAANYTDAEPLFREALAMRRRLLPETHADIAESLNNLAELLIEKGAYEEAEPLHRQALALHRTLYGEEHPLVASSLNNLARLFYSKGDYDAAEPLYRESLALRRKIYGDEHPRVATALNNLANLLHDKGDYEAAEPMYRETLALDRQLRGEEHPMVAIGLNNLAGLLRDKGDYDAAEPLYRESLALRRKIYGDEHPRVATALNSLARILQDKGALEEAETLMRASLTMRRNELGTQHADVAYSLANLGRLLLQKGDIPQAEPLLREALVIREQTRPTGHWEIAVAQYLLGACLIRRQRFDEAEGLLLTSYATLEEERSIQDQQTVQALERLIDLYNAWNKPDEAARYRTLLEEARTSS